MGLTAGRLAAMRSMAGSDATRLRRSTWIARTGVAAALLGCLTPPTAGATPSSWIAYHNARWDFRLRHPAGWATDQGGDGAGILLTRDGQAIAAGAGYAFDNDTEPLKRLDCARVGEIEPLISHSVGGVRDLRRTASKATRFRDRPACWEQWRFTLSGKHYAAEYVTVLHHGLEYHFSLECVTRDCPTVRRTYDAVIGSFRFGEDRGR